MPRATRIRIVVVSLAAALAAAGCAKKPANKAEAGQVAAPPAVPPTTEAGCRACNGEFGPHGIDPAPRCVCRTTDSGKKCRGKDDCQGECIGDAREQEVTHKGPPPLGFRQGRCSEFMTTFGCHVFLPPISSAPVRLDVEPEQLCVD
jgi:hypothetical protein